MARNHRSGHQAGANDGGRGDPPALGPDVLLGIWSTWMKSGSDMSQQWMSSVRPWWQLPDERAGDLLSAGAEQLTEHLAHDPLLKSIEQMWNANPLHDVIPLDWAGIAWALRTVWLRYLNRPDVLPALAELNVAVWRSALDIWNEAGRRWWGQASLDPAEAAKGGDRRFAAPEWHDNPVYRTLKEVYLLASDWLLKHGEVADMGEAERLRLDFHLRQFVDAMSPALCLASNPVALRRAFETGGTSLADGMRNLMNDIRQGRLSMVDASAFAPGRNLALTPGKVVHRNKLIELIQYEPQTPSVHKTPLLILPPWINKYYIMDMQPKNSMVAFLVRQGFTVFMVSWKNPDAAMEDTAIEDYVDLGPLQASNVVREITGSETVNVMEAGGWTGPPGFRSGPADWARPREWAAPRISRSRTRRAVTCLKGDSHWPRRELSLRSANSLRSSGKSGTWIASTASSVRLGLGGASGCVGQPMPRGKNCR